MKCKMRCLACGSATTLCANGWCLLCHATRGNACGKSPTGPAKVQPDKPAMEDLSGTKLGTLVVIRYHGPGGPSPWWLLRCKSCQHEQVRRGNAIRQARKQKKATMSCEGCRTRRAAKEGASR